MCAAATRGKSHGIRGSNSSELFGGGSHGLSVECKCKFVQALDGILKWGAGGGGQVVDIIVYVSGTHNKPPLRQKKNKKNKKNKKKKKKKKKNGKSNKLIKCKQCDD